MMQEKEKAPQAAATAQGATKENKVHDQSTAKAAKRQAYYMRQALESTRSTLYGLADLLEALYIASLQNTGYEEGIQVLSRIALRAAQDLENLDS